MNAFRLVRLAETDLSTKGEVLSPDGRHVCWTLERGPSNPGHPRIAAGSYPLTFRPVGSSKYEKTLRTLLGHEQGVCEVTGVVGRSLIEVHPANRFDQLLGCIAPGKAVVGASDGEWQIPPGMSSPAVKAFYEAITAAWPASLEVVDP